MKVNANTIHICGGNVNCFKLVISIFCVTNGSIRMRCQNNEVTSVTHIEDFIRHFLEEDLCGNNDDGDSAN